MVVSCFSCQEPVATIESSISLGIKRGQEKCQAILGLHSFTECDSIRALNKMDRENPWANLHDVEKFVCALHEPKYSAGVNGAMYNLFRLTC